MTWRIAGWVVTTGLFLAVFFSETFRAWVLLFLLFVGFAGFARFVVRGPLKWLVAGLFFGTLFGCGDGE